MKGNGGLGRLRPTAIVILILMSGLSLSLWAVQKLPPEVLAYADIVFYNGKVLTGDEKFSIAEGVAVRDAKILAVGESARLLEMAGPKTRKIDLNGNSVIPGFVIPHDHSILSRTDTVIRRLGQLTNLDDFLRELKATADAAKPGKWLIVEALRARALVEGLNRRILDSVAPNNLVQVLFDESMSVVNSRALSSISLDMPGVLRDENGEPNGHLRGGVSAMIVYEMAEWPEDLEPLIQEERETLAKYPSVGVTMVGGRASGLHVTILRELWSREQLPVRVRVSHEFPRHNLHAEAYFKRLGNLMGLGDDWFKISGATVGPVDSVASVGGTLSLRPKIWVPPVGGFGPYGQNKWASSRTGAYDPREQDVRWKERGEYRSVILANRYGWNVTDMHGQGDGAMAIVLEAVEKANQEKSLVGKRFGTSHNIMRTPEQIRRMVELGMTVSISPKYLFDRDVTPYQRQYGADAVNRMSPVKSMINSGMKPALEPNQSVRSSEFTSYLRYLENFITRQNEHDGRVWGPEERVSRQEALWMATVWSARYYFEEERVGSIEPGKLADLVVLGGDYMTVPEEEISDIPVLMTVIGGKVAFEK